MKKYKFGVLGAGNMLPLLRKAQCAQAVLRLSRC